MAKKHLLGAAGIALIAATVSAQAADVPPVTFTTTPVAPAATGPEITVEVVNSLRMGWPFGDPPSFGDFFAFDVDVKQASGWGYELAGYTGFGIRLPIEGLWGLLGRVYRSAGNLEVGAYGVVSGPIPFTAVGFGLGWDLEYQAGNLTVYNDNFFGFGAGGIQFIGNFTEVAVDVSERLTVAGQLDLGFSGGPISAILGAWAELDLGTFTPYVRTQWSLTSAFWDLGIGVAAEHAIGTGPFSLIASGEVRFGSGGAGVLTAIGIRYTQGDVDNNKLDRIGF